MTRKDYQALAKIIAQISDNIERQIITEDLIEYLRSTNNLFKPQRFRDSVKQAR